ncbi:MAG: phosphatidate cytidylyltransferase [Defluviitaleaceae bacterium]|nr:phosphatidate cytidylyltransferase [Defluviitaleaceae bacterium]
MLKRIITAIIGLPFVIFLVIFGGWPLFLMCLVLALMGLRELYRAFSKADKFVHVIGYTCTIGYFIGIFIGGVGQWLFLALAFFIIIVQTFLVLFFNKLALEDVLVTIYGLLYVPFLLSFIILVREYTLGQYFIWLIFTAAFGCDTFAYMAGVTVGRHKLKNSPSPKKSVEGLIGGVLGAALVGFLYGFFIVRFFDPGVEHFILISVIVSLIGAALCIFGDMAASAIKRRTDIKDFSSLLPGHGGVIDRADGIMFVAPFVFLVMRIIL